MNDSYFRFFRARDFSAACHTKGILFFIQSDSSLWGIPSLGNGWHERLFDDSALLHEFFHHLQVQVRSQNLNAATVDQYWKQERLGVSAVNVNLTPRCNLDCVYCYARGGDYQRIQAEMAPEAAVTDLDEILAHADPERDFRLEFFGGEPLLNRPAIAAILDRQQTDPAWTRLPHGWVNRISTNLSVAGNEGLDLLTRGNMVVSVSLDGFAEVQNAQRPFKDGRGSFDIIMKNVEALRKAGPDLRIVARITVFQQAPVLFETVTRLAETGLFDYVSIYPAAVPAADDGGKGRTFFSRELREQLILLAEAYPELLAKGRFKGWLELNRYLESMMTGRTAVNHCRAGAGYFTLSPDRSFHPCHRLVGDERWNLRSVLWDKQALKERLQPWQTSVHAREKCRTCEIRYLCGGGCKQQALAATGDLLGTDARTCSFANVLWETALNAVCALVHSPQFQGGGWNSFASTLGEAFRESDRMFVFCGQPTVKNHRSLPAGEVSLKYADQLWAIRPIFWNEQA